MPWTWAALALASCSGKAQDSGNGGDGGDPVDLPIGYPSGERVLVYYGHGGASGDGTGRGLVTELEAISEDELGFPLDWRDYLPDDLSSYRAILLMGSGMEGEVAYTADQSAAFRSALDQGARLVLLAETETCSLPVFNDLLTGLGSTLALTGEGAGQNKIVTADIVSDQSQVVSAVETLQMKDPCYLEGGGGTVLAKDDDRNVLLAVERPSPTAGAETLPGDIVLVGDLSVLDDSGGLSEADNRQLAVNLVKVEP